jgi:hypothetical protein
MRIHIEFGLGYRKMGDRRAEINQKTRAIVHRFDTAVETLEARIDFGQEFLEVFE